MRARLASQILLPTLALCLACTRDNPAHTDGRDRGVPLVGEAFVEGEVLVRYSAAMTAEEIEPRLEAWGATILAELGSPQEGDLNLIHLGGSFRVGLPAGMSVQEGITLLSMEGDLDFVEPNYIVEATLEPNDPHRGRLWGMDKIGAPTAWDIHTGDPAVIVGVIDTGVDYNHPDLKANAWTNPGEIPGNGVDDDGNGYVDDVHGYDFCNFDADPMDDHGHGTHCAGTIGGVGDNGEGVVGVGWRTRIMALKFLCADGRGSSASAALAVLYAADNGATLTSNSWGGGGYSVTMYNAIQYARERDQLFIAAAGNDGRDNDRYTYYPSNYDAPNVVSVAASDSSDRRASFSNYGATQVDLAAPGVSIYSSVTSGRYSYASGTSMATPHVAGAVGLLYALNPEMGYELARQRLLDSVDPLAGWAGVVATGGRLNVARMLQSFVPPPPAPALEARADGPDGIIASWGAVEDAKGYRLYLRAASGEQHAPFELLETSIEIRPLVEGTWFVSVSALNGGGEGARSPEIEITLVDETPPGQIIDLYAAAAPGGRLHPDSIQSTDEIGAAWSADRLLDDDDLTGWASWPTEAQTPARITLDLGAPQAIGEIALRPMIGFEDVFPLAFEIRAAAEPGDWQVVARELGAEPPLGWARWPFAPVEARYVEIVILERAEHPSGLLYSALGDVALYGPPVGGELLLGWTAPGDDDQRGQATRYEIRYGEEVHALEDLEQARVYEPAPDPLSAGTRQWHVLMGLEGGVEYGVSLRAFDDQGAAGPFSPIARASTAIIPPGGIEDLALTAPEPGILALRFTAPADDGHRAETGAADHYDVRLSARPITGANWPDATPLTLAPAGEPGSEERFELADLPAESRYYLRIRAVDSGGLAGPWSDQVDVDPGHRDDEAPATVQDLHAVYAALEVQPAPLVTDQVALVDGDVMEGWMEAVDGPVTLRFDLNGAEAPLAELRLRPHWLYPGDFPAEITLVAHAAGAADEEITRWASPIEPGAWIEIPFAPVTADAFSLILTPNPPRFGVTALALGEVEAYTARIGGGAARFTFIAPGDDGFMGRARLYDLRWSRDPILDEAGFDAAAAFQDLPAPLDGGSPEVIFAHDLPDNGTIHFALVTEDESGNRSGVSNPAQITIPAFPPPAVTDLRVVGVERGALTVAYTAPGDAGLWAEAIDLRVIEGEMTPASFEQARQVDAPAPPLSGEGAEIRIDGLEPGARYEIALVALRGEARSPLSNVAQGRTIEATPPGQIVDLIAERLDAGVELRWTAPGDDGHEGQAARYEARWALSAQDLLTGAATPIPLADPQPAGRPEAALVQDLPLESRLFFTVWAVDDVDNHGQPSNVAEALTPGEAPARVEDLRVEDARVDRLTLAFTAVGDDGHEGQASSYDLRVSEAPIDTLDAFAAAAVVPTGDPKAAGQAEQVQVRDLEQARRYFFALVVEDDAGNRSPMATLSAETVDEIAPERTEDLRASAQDGGAPLSAVVVAVSSEYDPRTSATGLIDANPSTVWITEAAEEAQAEWAVFDLGVPHAISGLRVRAAPDHLNLFPETLAFEVERDGAFEPLLEIQGARAEDWIYRAFAPIEARRVRVTIPATRRDDGRYLAAVGGLELLGADPNSVSARLDWTAPADVGPDGRAASYELRFAPFAFEAATFERALLTEGPIPAAAGAPQTWIIGDLEPDTDYYFAFISTDAAGNRSPVSNVAHFHTDALPPSTVHDLEALIVGERVVTLGFTAPGAAGGLEQAEAYELRYTTGALNEETWAEATPTPMPPPRAHGEAEAAEIDGLEPSTTYRFAVRALDAEGRIAPLSNVVEARTDDPPERIPPSVVADLSVEADPNQDGALRLRWTAPGDDGDLGVATRYELRRFQPPAEPESGEELALDPPRPGGALEAVTLVGFPNEAEIHLALRAFDDIGNVAEWATASGVTRPVPPAQIVDLRAEIEPDLITLRWTAPGADGEIGRASRYELFVETHPIANPDLEAPVEGLEAPAPAGTPESFALQLPPDVPHFAALRAIDDKGHAGALSPIIEITALDTIPPGPFSDVVAETGRSRGTVDVSFTAPGDDGLEGRATAFEIRWRLLGGAWFVYGGAVSPPQGGQAGRVTLSGLADEDRVEIELVAIDNAGLRGPAARVEADTPAVAPGRVSDLTAESAGPDGVRLTWTAPGDDGQDGQATRYALRYSPDRLDWEGGVEVPLPPPMPAGAVESTLVQGLESGRRYAFALRAIDERGAEGLLSNTATVDTDDVTPPAAVADLRAELLESGRVRLTWTAAGDDDREGRAAHVEIRYAPEPWPGFEGATPVAQSVSVVEGGSPQQVDLVELPREQRVALALITVDEGGNAAAPSNVVVVETAPLPPGDLDGFAAEPEGADALRLSWICPADDAGDPDSGPAERIEIFLSEGLFSANTLDSARLVAEAPTCPPGAAEGWRLGGLDDDTAYWVAARAVDDRGGLGALSEVIEVHTPDVTPPSAVVSLRAEGPRSGGDPLGVATVAASDALSAAWPAAAAFDGAASTAWATQDQGEGAWIEARLQAPGRVGGVRLWVDQWVDRFPTDLTLLLDGEEVAHAGALAPQAHGWVELSFAPRRAEALRVEIARAGEEGAYVVLNEIEILPADDPADTITLTWVAPGDDGDAGQATRIDARYATQPITPASFAGATPIEAPAPAPAGQPQRLDVSGLEEETRYFFALVVEDEAGNRSPLSNVAEAQTGGVPPAMIQDLEVVEAGDGRVVLAFTAPGDDGDEGQAAFYDLRYRAYDLSGATWDEGVMAATPMPQPAGARETVEVHGLLPGTLYAFGVRAVDLGGNVALLSNVAHALTDPAPDVVAPDPVDLLSARRAEGGAVDILVVNATGSQFPDFPEDALLDGDEGTAWASPARDAPGEETLTLTIDQPRALAELRLLPHPDFVDLFPSDLRVERSVNGIAWEEVARVSGHEAVAGRWSVFALDEQPAKAVRIVAQRRWRAPAHLSVIAEAALIEAASPDVVTLTFRAPGDDGEIGQATRYLLARSDQPIDEARWDQLEIVELAQAPQPSGAPEAVVLEGVGPGAHHFAIRAEDEAGNLGALGATAHVD